MTFKGIDVSVHQGNINWTKVKGNVSFVILRAGYGDAISYPNQVDNTFEKNYKGCKDNGIPCGVYWYSYAQSVEAAKQEAKACLKVIKSKKFEYPIYFDLEEQSQFNKGKNFCNSIVKAFCTEIENAGYYAGLYMSRSPLQTYISSDVAKKYTLWIAEYNSKCNYSGTHDMWQYKSTGKISGISGNVDMNYCYKDFPTAIKSAGLNGYTKSETNTTKEKPVLDKSGFKKGDKSDGVLALKEILIIAKAKGLHNHNVDENGTFGNGTSKAVNALLKKWGYKETGIAGTKFIKKLTSAIK